MTGVATNADRVTQAMTDVWPKVVAAMEKGLRSNDAGPAIGDLITTRALEDALPFTAKVEFLREAGLHPAKVSVSSSAYQFLGRLNFRDADELRDNLAEELGEIRRWATEQRRAERNEIVKLVIAASKSRPFTIQSIETATAESPGSWRLIGREDGTAKDARTRGLIDDIAKPPGSILGPNNALLVRLASGPLLSRIVEDLTPTWQRLGNDGVSFIVTSRFFVDVPPSSAFRLVAPTLNCDV